MPSAANGKSEKPASAEATDNSPVRQILTVIEHKIRNLEKRKSKLTSYRDLQKAGKDLNADQKVAVAKYDEVAQTLEFARDLSKQIASIATSAEREAKKQAKKEAWVRYASESSKIREVLLILDCLNQMGSSEAREDFLNGSNGAAKLAEQDLKILDDLYPEVTPKHEVNEEGQPGFHIQASKAAEHLYAIIDGKPKEVLGTTYAHIKKIVTTVHECGYFDKTEGQEVADDTVEVQSEVVGSEEEPQVEEPCPEPQIYAVPVPPAGVVPPQPYPQMRPLPPITLQEVEHAYFAQQYPQQRPISEVIGSQNFFFLQESEIDSPAGTPQPPTVLAQASPPMAIPTQTFTNQHFVQIGARVPEPGMPLPPQQHFPPEMPMTVFPAPPAVPPASMPAPQPAAAPPAPSPARPQPSPPQSDQVDEWKESESPEVEDGAERKTQGQGDGRYRRDNRDNRYSSGRGERRGPSNGYRGRGGFQPRQNNDGGYHNRDREYQRDRPSKDGYQGRHNDNYQPRHKEGYSSRGGSDNYYGNGDSGSGHERSGENDRDRYDNGYGGGFKSRGRGGSGPRAPRGTRPAPRPQHYRTGAAPAPAE